MSMKSIQTFLTDYCEYEKHSDIFDRLIINCEYEKHSDIFDRLL